MVDNLSQAGECHCLFLSLFTVVYPNIGNAAKSMNPIPRVIKSDSSICKRFAPVRITVHIPIANRLNVQNKLIVFILSPSLQFVEKIISCLNSDFKLRPKTLPGV